MTGSSLFGDALRVIGTDSASGREYRCPCGWTGFSVWGGARNHSHECGAAWTSGVVPADHSAAGGPVVRGRGPCPVCARDVAWRRIDHPYDNKRSIARHNTRDGAPCWAHRWDVFGGHVSGFDRVTRSVFHSIRVEPRDTDDNT